MINFEVRDENKNSRPGQLIRCNKCNRVVPHYTDGMCKRCYTNVNKVERQDNKNARLRFAILQRDNFTCQYCGRTPREHGIVLQVDHIIPRSLGGDNTQENLITACLECNIGKGNTPISEKKMEAI